MSNMPQPPAGPPSMPRHTNRPIAKPPLPRRYTLDARDRPVAEGTPPGRTIRIDLAEVDASMVPFGAS